LFQLSVDKHDKRRAGYEWLGFEATTSSSASSKTSRPNPTLALDAFAYDLETRAGRCCRRSMMMAGFSGGTMDTCQLGFP
jgi:hypothetical protein